MSAKCSGSRKHLLPAQAGGLHLILQHLFQFADVKRGQGNNVKSSKEAQCSYFGWLYAPCDRPLLFFNYIYLFQLPSEVNGACVLQIACEAIARGCLRVIY